MPLKTTADYLALVGRLVVVGIRDDEPGKLGREFIGVVRDLSDSGRHLVLTDVEEAFFETEESEISIVVRHAHIAIPLESIDVIDPTSDVRYRTDRV
jgi:hypothetical protein